MTKDVDERSYIAGARCRLGNMTLQQNPLSVERAFEKWFSWNLGWCDADMIVQMNERKPFMPIEQTDPMNKANAIICGQCFEMIDVNVDRYEMVNTDGMVVQVCKKCYSTAIPTDKNA
jgi:hypothetical protein